VPEQEVVNRGNRLLRVADPRRMAALAVAEEGARLVQRQPARDAVGERREDVDETPVEVEPALVDGAASRRHDARPGDREPVGAKPELAHQRDVLGDAMVVVGGDVAVVAVAHLAARVREAVPDRRPAPVFARSALRSGTPTSTRPQRKPFVIPSRPLA
jgi:hypothetical protein